jgi:hypothetical protein
MPVSIRPKSRVSRLTLLKIFLLGGLVAAITNPRVWVEVQKYSKRETMERSLFEVIHFVQKTASKIVKEEAR